MSSGRLIPWDLSGEQEQRPSPRESPYGLAEHVKAGIRKRYGLRGNVIGLTRTVALRVGG